MGEFSKERRSELKKQIEEEQKAKEREYIERKNRHKEMRDEARKKGKSLCSACKFDGTLVAVEIETGASYSFRCPYCGAADLIGLTDTYPQWEDKHKARFKLIY